MKRMLCLVPLAFTAMLYAVDSSWQVKTSTTTNLTTVSVAGKIVVRDERASTATPSVEIENGTVTVKAIKFSVDGTILTSSVCTVSPFAGSGDMVQATHGVAIAASTTTLRTDVTALQTSTGTLASTLAQVQIDTATLAGMVGSGASDNLGNHVATTTLDMANFSVLNIRRINTAYGADEYNPFVIGADTSTYGGVSKLWLWHPGFMEDGHFEIKFNYRDVISFRNGTTDGKMLLSHPDYPDKYIKISNTNIVFSTNTETLGTMTATEFYGNVSNCTGFPAAAGDNFGNHTATTTINMAKFQLNNVSTITLRAIDEYEYNPNKSVYMSVVDASEYAPSTAFTFRMVDEYNGNSSSVYHIANNGLFQFDGAPYSPSGISLGGTISINAGTAIKSDQILAIQNIDSADKIAIHCGSGYINTVGSVTASAFYGDGSHLSGLPGGGDMVQATHGVAIGASTATLRSDVTAIQSTLTNVGASTATLRTDITAIGTATGTIAGQITAIGASTGTLRTDLSAIAVSTGAFTAVGTSTATLRTDLNAVRVSTGAFTAVGASTATLRTDITTLWTATGTLKAQVEAVALSTGAFTTIATATGTLRTDVDALKSSTGAVSYTADFMTYGATQTFVSYMSTRVVCGLQTTGFTISSATARVNGGTSATIRLYITAKNSEFSITSSTPIWGTGVVAGTAHTGGTMSNVSVAADQCITAVIDAISGGVSDILVWVRGNR